MLHSLCHCNFVTLMDFVTENHHVLYGQHAKSGQMKMIPSDRIKHLLSDTGGERTGLFSRTSCQSVGQTETSVLRPMLGTE